MKKIIFILFIISGSAIAFSQQKFGYLNSAEILSKVPGIALADSSLKKYQDTLTISIQEKIKVFQKHVADYQAEQQKGNLAPIAAQKKEEELQKEQESLRAFEEELKQKLAFRRDLLYSPILDKMDAIVKRIGKDQKYTMIFDSSQPGYLYLAESDDLGPLVLKEVLEGK
jgi:outer membrane protein